LCLGVGVGVGSGFGNGEGGCGTGGGSFSSLTFPFPNNLIKPLFLCFRLFPAVALASLAEDACPVTSPFSEPLRSGCLMRYVRVFFALVLALIERARERASKRFASEKALASVVEVS
jgi:hypothetical protein